MDHLALEMTLGLMILWGLVTPEKMAGVTFRALHSFTQEMDKVFWPHPQMVKKVAEASPGELMFQSFPEV